MIELFGHCVGQGVRGFVLRSGDSGPDLDDMRVTCVIEGVPVVGGCPVGSGAVPVVGRLSCRGIGRWGNRI